MKWFRNIVLNEADDEAEEPATMQDEAETEAPEDDDPEATTEQPEADEPATMDARGGDAETQAEEPATMDDGETDTEIADEPATMDDGGETTDVEEGEAEEPATMDDGGGEDPTGDVDEEGMEGEDNIEDGETNDEEGMEGEETGEDDSSSDNLKKLKLLNEYKELYDIVNNIEQSLNNLEGRVDKEKTSILDHAERLVLTLKQDLLFVISNKFIDLSYTDLIANFYRFKYQVQFILKIVDYLVQDEKIK